MTKPNKNRSTIYFTSDLHFGHTNIFKFCPNRTSNTCYDMDTMKETIVKRWNRVVKPQDTVIVVGDVFFYHTRDEMLETMNRLNGTKILVRGNHDLKNKQMMNAGFDWSCDEMVLEIAKERVTISHYPFRHTKWRRFKFKFKAFFLNLFKKKKIKIFDDRYKGRRPVDVGQFLIHGHTHSEEKVNGRMIHVGWDAWGGLVSINKIADVIEHIRREENGSKDKPKSKTY